MKAWWWWWWWFILGLLVGMLAESIIAEYLAPPPTSPVNWEQPEWEPDLPWLHKTETPL
jgi:hypothetical protein